MTPTLQPGDRILVNKGIMGGRIFDIFASAEGEEVPVSRLPGWRKLKRNDVVVFNDPYARSNDYMSMDLMRYYVKRCIALPGDTLEIVQGHYRIKGLDEPVGNMKAQAVLEHPWTGVGWEQVPGAYGDAQERYFASGEATAQEEHVAGSPEYVFNEYLQVAMAWGVPALCGILMVVIVLFCLGHGDRQYGACGGLLSLGVFAFSSYPFHHRLPNRIYPYYLLVKLYAEHPDVFSKEKLEQAARMVMEKEPKVESTAIREMREEVRRVMEEICGIAWN